MNRKNECVRVFLWAAAIAYALYMLTLPEGLPWGVAHPLASAWMWVALAAGLLGALVARYCGWRIGAAVAIVWMFLPEVWNRAILGDRIIAFTAFGICGLWLVNVILLFVFRKAIKTRAAAQAQGFADISNAAKIGRRGWKNWLASWGFFAVAVLYAIVSITAHDYRIGEAASAYARLIVEEAGERVILLNGACDEQIVHEVERLGDMATISFRQDDANRSNLVAWAKATFPAETNLWLAAQISPAAFADAAVKAHPDRFYAMMGQSTTPEKWAARWAAMKPYLDSGDKFISQMRHIFAYEANTLGNVLQGKGELKAAWNLYLRIFEEIDPKNPAACVNLNGMLQRGYKVDEGTRQRVESAQADFAKLLKDKEKAARVAARIAAFGPVMRDQKAYDELCERVKRQMEELEKKGEKPPMSAELKTLTEWNDEMMKAFMEKDFDKATHIARAILSRRQWRGFIPANMVLGEQMILQGNLVAAEAFLRVAIEGKGEAAPPPQVLNDYAEALRQLKRYDEAEKYARKAIGSTDEKMGWIYRLTLAQILRDVGKNPEEVKILVKDTMKHAPEKARAKIRKEFPR